MLQRCFAQPFSGFLRASSRIDCPDLVVGKCWTALVIRPYTLLAYLARISPVGLRLTSPEALPVGRTSADT